MKQITIYISSECEKCHEAIAFLNKNNIAYKAYNISEDKVAKKDIMKKGYMSVPLIMIDDKVIIGFDRKEIASLLGL